MSNAADQLVYDLVLVGGSSSNFALAHRLVQLAKDSGLSLSIAILEKAREFGGHILSGAVSNPHVIRKLFPEYETNGFPIEGVCDKSYFTVLGSEKAWNIPGPLTPDEFRKEGYLILSLSMVVSWMANHLQEQIKDSPNIVIDFFPGFAAHEIKYDASDKVIGVRVSNSGNDAEDVVYGNVTVFGDKGFLSQDLVEKFKLRKNPQLWSVGVKELWEVSDDRFLNKVWHTMGYPILDGTFGGGFIYGMKNKRLTIGLVISLDSQNPNINPQQRLQDYKKHPLVQEMLKGGRLIKYGAALLPEGGYYSLPEKFATDGAMLVGDALGTLNPRKLRGIDMAMECGYQAAEVLHEAFKEQNFSQAKLNQYQDRLNNTFVMADLKESRYFRQAFIGNPKLLGSYLPKVTQAVDSGAPLLGPLMVGLSDPIGASLGAAKMVLQFNGNIDQGTVTYKPCHEHIDPKGSTNMAGKVSASFDKETVYSRADAVFYANPRYHEENEHIDEFNADTCVKCISHYDALGKETPCVSDCTAEVHRVDDIDNARKHGMSLENCIQCRTCEIVCPEVNLRVNAAYEGSGPDFLGM